MSKQTTVYATQSTIGNHGIYKCTLNQYLDKLLSHSLISFKKAQHTFIGHFYRLGVFKERNNHYCNVITLSPTVESIPCLLLQSLARPKSVMRTCSGLWTTKHIRSAQHHTASSSTIHSRQYKIRPTALHCVLVNLHGWPALMTVCISVSPPSARIRIIQCAYINLANQYSSFSTSSSSVNFWTAGFKRLQTLHILSFWKVLATYHQWQFQPAIPGGHSPMPWRARAYNRDLKVEPPVGSRGRALGQGVRGTKLSWT